MPIAKMLSGGVNKPNEMAKKFRVSLGDTLRRFGIDYLYYVTLVDNVPSILAGGILSYNKVKKVPHLSMANQGVQDLRDRIIPGINKPLHDFVPLFFATHTPMQYKLVFGNKYSGGEVEPRDFVIIKLNAPAVFKLPKVIFTDGNAATKKTAFYSNLSDLNKLDWHIIHHKKCWGDYYKWKKSAEVLVYGKVPFGCFKQIIVCCDEAKENLIRMARAYAKENNTSTHLSNIDVEVDKDLWYYNY